MFSQHFKPETIHFNFFKFNIYLCQQTLSLKFLKFIILHYQASDTLTSSEPARKISCASPYLPLHVETATASPSKWAKEKYSLPFIYTTAATTTSNTTITISTSMLRSPKVSPIRTEVAGDILDNGLSSVKVESLSTDRKYA